MNNDNQAAPPLTPNPSPPSAPQGKTAAALGLPGAVSPATDQGQKSLLELLEEIERKWRGLDHHFEIAADNVALVKALRMAISVIQRISRQRDNMHQCEVDLRELAQLLQSPAESVGEGKEKQDV